jgi:hypothetical protein
MIMALLLLVLVLVLVLAVRRCSLLVVHKAAPATNKKSPEVG